MYKSYVLTPGIEYSGSFFCPLDSLEEAERRAAISCGVEAFALFGLTPCGCKEQIMLFYEPDTLLRRVNMIWGLGIEWSGESPLEFSPQGVKNEEVHV